MKRCFLYPGQGAQYPGMGEDLWNQSSRVRELFGEASDETGIHLEKVLFDGTDEELKKTENSQVAITTVSLSAMIFLAERGIFSDACAGFSLGEYAALVDAGILSQKGIFKLVRKRGEIMAKAASELETGPAGMAAVLGLDFEEAQNVMEELSAEEVYLANHSSPSQIVISGSQTALAKADTLFDKAGALRFVHLKVSGPFHSPLMAAAREELAEYLAEVDFTDPVKPVFSNFTGARILSGAEARGCCIEQMVSPVRWVSIEQQIEANGFDQILEVGPGTVLTGLWKSYTKALRCKPAGTVEAALEIEV